MILSASQVLDRIQAICLEPDLISAKLVVRRALVRRRKRIVEALKRFQQELERCAAWKTLENEAHYLQAHFKELKRGQNSVEFEDWEHPGQKLTISLDPAVSPQENVSTRFHNAGKYKKGIPHLARMAAKTAQDLIAFEEHFNSLANAQYFSDLESIKLAANLGEKQPLPSKKKEEKVAKPFLEFFSASGTPIWVGKNAKCNDKLTFHHANGLDTWLHAVGVPGSHVIIRNPKGSEPDPETLNDAVQLALHYSKAKSRQEGEVCITQRKYVSRIGQNQPGKVQLSRQKTVYVKSDESRLQDLRNRKRSALPI